MPITSLSTTVPHGGTAQAHPAADVDSGRSPAAHKSRGSLATGDLLTQEERQQVADLKKVDREVRAHEQAHLARAGPYATGAPSFTYTTGPDGRQYAIAGEVKVDTSPEADPEDTLRKAKALEAAAVAPAEPSGQDRSVAAAASRMARKTERELADQRAEREEGGAETRLRAYGQPPPDDAGRLLSLVV